MMRFYRLILLILVTFNLFETFGQDAVQKKHLVISLTLNGKTLYDGFELNKGTLDSTDCLQLKFDTLTTVDTNLTGHLRNFLMLDIDTTKIPSDYSIKCFSLYLACIGADNGYFSSTNCFTNREIQMLKRIDNPKEDAHLIFYDIRLIIKQNNLTINFPDIQTTNIKN